MRSTDLEIDEMAISVTHTDTKPGDQSSIRDDDRKITTGKGLAKIQRMWHSSVADVALYIHDVGYEPTKALSLAIDGGADQAEQDVADLKGLEQRIRPDPNTITVVFTNNEGARRKPLTGWIIAHRMFHSFQSTKKTAMHNAASAGIEAINDAIYEQMSGIMFDLEDGYCYEMSKYHKACLMGASKACREFNLSNTGELIPECFAQYMLTGKVTMRELPATVTIDGTDYRAVRSNLRYANIVVESFGKFLEKKFAEIIGLAKGKVFGL